MKGSVAVKSLLFPIISFFAKLSPNNKQVDLKQNKQSTALKYTICKIAKLNSD